MRAVLNADSIINFPDFRSAERAFNMLEQVWPVPDGAGHRGTVVVQTWRPGHPVLKFVENHDYQGYFAREIAEREKCFYPPFTRVIYMYVKHRDPARLRAVADIYAGRLRVLLGNRVFVPFQPGVARVQGLYIRKIMLKIEVNASMRKVKELLRQPMSTCMTFPR